MLAISVIAPFVYALIQGYLALLLVPAIQNLGIQSPRGLQGMFFAFGLSGSLLAAIVLACPLSYLAQQKSSLLGFLLGFITIATLVATEYLHSGNVAFNRMFFDHVAFIAFCGLAPVLANSYRAAGRA